MEQEDEEESPQIFLDENGFPLRIFLHRSITQEGARNALTLKIKAHGGELVETDTGSNIIIVNPNHPAGDLDRVRHAYKTHSNLELSRVWVEPMKFIGNCVKNGRCTHVFNQKGMGGATAGRGRTSFTNGDDYQLCRYLAILIPVKDDGGRTGQSIYKGLVANAQILPEEYDWVNRHTWQSWRERYKTRQRIFDPIIADMAGATRHRAAPEAVHTASQHEYLFEDDELEGEEGMGEEVNGGPSRKRPAPASGPSQPNSKRLRADPSPSPDPDVNQGVRSSAKGKEREIPSHDDDGYNSDRSLFGDYDPTQHSPAPEVYVSPQRLRSSQVPAVRTAPTRDGPSSAPPDQAGSSVQPPRVPDPPARRQQPARDTRVSATRPPRKRTSSPPQKSRLHIVIPEPDPGPWNHLWSTAGKERRRPLSRRREVGEEDPDAPFRDVVPEGTVETQEEQNVEDFLMATNDQSGVSELDAGDTVVEVNEMPPPRETRRQIARQPSPDTDDGQSDLALHWARQVSFSPSITSKFGTQRAREVLRNLGGPRLSRPPGSVTSKGASSPLFTQNSSPDLFSGLGGRSATLVPSIDFQNPLYSHSVRSTPVRSHKDSVSSTESFPIMGTRARQLKLEIKAHEKHTPYRPPAGTRAAAHVKSL
ncbi:hypothetical protein B0H10DRAFT_2006309 [Mycena sp. CBHHK59/15]|nr:hypothetical protein B0H10DRAFT_2006309 [Mycena sp. CBHHK59/15]